MSNSKNPEALRIIAKQMDSAETFRTDELGVEAACLRDSADEIERLQAREARLREALEDHIRAAECIRHWHDALPDSSGMVVSAEHVRLLWSATSRARAALAEQEKK